MTGIIGDRTVQSEQETTLLIADTELKTCTVKE